MTPKFTIDQRRARLAVRHHLAAPAATAEAAAEGVVALHATDPATVYLSARARLAERGTAVEDVERALYTDRGLLRLLGMRRTMFVAGLEVAALIQAGCTPDVAAKQRKLLIKHLAEQGHPENVTDAARWLAEVEQATEAALAARGQAPAQVLVEDEPRLRQQLIMAKGKPYEAVANVTSRVLNLLGADGRIVRGRPRGSWVSTQYHWATLGTWLPAGLTEWEAPAARAELARRWLHAYGPAPAEDLRWWTGWTAGQVKQALARLGTVEVGLGGAPSGTGLVLADDLEPVAEPGPWVALLPALDPTPMGWAARDWYVGEHRAALFDRSGNIGPTVWCDGRVVGGWAQRTDGEVRIGLLEDIGAEAKAAAEAEADRLAGWFGVVRVVPRFRTPLERELAG
ncbi:winged helix DNA-binding domain-containing protein [Amycolatopsis sp. NPDC059027]|uniref:winged helix DNA-binding domain-containing protein n=1 Tax=unclassified Amycolatopsis TaxID=2618356 RepID=UPI00366B56DF